MEICAIVTSICTCVCAPGVRGACVSWCLRCRNPKKKLEKLVLQINELKEQATKIPISINQVKIKQGRVDIEIEAVDKWLNDVNKKGNEVGIVLKKLACDKKWMCGLVPNYRSRWKVNGKITEACEEEVLVELKKKGDELYKDLENLASRLPTKGDIIPVKMTIFDSTKGYIDIILKYLMEESVTRIGLYGMGGIGKTTLLKAVYNRLLKENLGFESIHWVTASEDINLYSLQKEIAKSIGLQYTEDEDQARRASKLHNSLMAKGNVVLILDNLWEAFALEEIGIPSNNGCKVIITTRVSAVCRGMTTNKDVEIKELTKDDAWTMFESIVEMDVHSKPKATQDIMKDVANECGGLPLAIGVVAKAMRNVNNDLQWTQALNDLRYHGDNIITRDEKVFAALRLSYVKLREEMDRSCFLYCALYPAGHQIETKELIEYWTWEGMLGDSEMLEDYMRKGEKVLFELTDASILETTGEVNGKITSVKMHDMVREMAKSINPGRCLIQSGIGLKKPPYEGNWTNVVERISLMRNDLKELPPSPLCPKLSTLLLQYNSLSNTLSPYFFTHFISLKVLDLSFTGISALPDSLSGIVSLEALLLRNCWYLVSLPSLARLIKLRVLDLSFTPITILPRGMELLTNLRSINLSHTNLGVLLGGVFDKYTRLEHLLVQGWDLIWDSSDASTFKGAVLDELIGANNLRVLNATLRDIRVLTIFATLMENLQLHSFQLWVGQQLEVCENDSSSVEGKSVTISGCELQNNFILLPPTTTELFITICFSDRPSPLVLYNSSDVKKFTVKKCQEITGIQIDEGDAYLKSLEKLELNHMENMQKLFHGNLRPGTLENLKILHIFNCNTLQSLLDYSWLQHLSRLQEIHVKDCDAMEEIISMGETISGAKLEIQEHQINNGTVELHSLYKLHFSKLKSLTSVFNGTLVCQSLHSIEVSECPKLERIPCFNPAPRALSIIKGEREWWNKLNWDHVVAGTKERFQPVFVQVEKEEQEEQAECSNRNG